jgi:hypothetical protein
LDRPTLITCSFTTPINDDQSQSSNPTDQQQHHSFIGPIEALSGLHTQHLSYAQHQILPARSASSMGYKKTFQSANPTTMVNANRYSYMMAVNTHPVAMKEHRL